MNIFSPLQLQLQLLLFLFLALTLSVIVESVDSATTQSSRLQSQQLHKQYAGELIRRRRLLRETSCKLFHKCVEFGPTTDHPNGRHEETWVCELSKDDFKRSEVQFVDIVETPSVSAALADAISGESTLTMSEAIVDTDSPKMYIPDHAQFRVGRTTSSSTSKTKSTGSIHTQERHRHLTTKTTGTLKALVIRVTDKNGVGPDAGVLKLKNDVFDDPVSLRTQTHACSYGKLLIAPFVGSTPADMQIDNGIIEVKVNDFATGEGGLAQAALREANKIIGSLDHPMFGLVLVCLPSDQSNGIAWAFPNTKYSFYSNQWCGSVAAQMHEVGHNLGLAHSGQLGEDVYGDQTGAMGAASNNDDNFRICYNPQKNYQLGWYVDKVKTINPLDGIGRREFLLNGVSEYRKESNDDDALVVLRLKQMAFEQDYYIGFNRATGRNRDTLEDANMVTVVRKDKGSPEEYGQSTKVATLIPGQRHVINDFNGDRNIQVVFSGLKNGDAKLMVIDDDEPPFPPVQRCKKVTIELETDRYPEDTRWYITDDGSGEAIAASPLYTAEEKTHEHEVCLPMRPTLTRYKFIILDKYGDGLCCQQGQGSYTAYDDEGQTFFSGGEFSTIEHRFINVPRDPNPPPPTLHPTPAPTIKPTPTPPCEEHTVEVKTNAYPMDNSWKIVGWNWIEDEVVVAESPAFLLPDKIYRTSVCLTENKAYEFHFVDEFNDGICCGESHGYYQVLDKCGEVVVDSGGIDENFAQKVHSIEVVDNKKCDGSDDQNNNNTCSDKMKKPFLSKKRRGKKRGKKRPCQWYSQKNKCERRAANGKFVWELCELSCNRCPEEENGRR